MNRSISGAERLARWNSSVLTKIVNEITHSHLLLLKELNPPPYTTLKKAVPTARRIEEYAWRDCNGSVFVFNYRPPRIRSAELSLWRDEEPLITELPIIASLSIVPREVRTRAKVIR